MLNGKRLIFFSLVMAVIFPGAISSQIDPATAAGNQVLTENRIKQKAFDFLLSRLPWEKDRMELLIHYDGGPLVLPTGPVSLDFSMSGRTDRAGIIPLGLRVRVGDDYQRRVRLSANVRVIQEIIKTTRAIRRGDVLTENDVRMERISTTRPLSKAATELENVIGYEARRNIPIGRALMPNHLFRPALINKGDPVTIVARKGPMKITTQGVAREKGFKDSLVKVTNVQSKKIIHAHVLDKNTVEVRF